MNQKIQDFQSATLNFSPKIRDALMMISDNIKESSQEICLKINNSVTIFSSQNSFFLGSDGSLSSEDYKSMLISQEDIMETLKILCNFSIYSFQNQIKDGFITLKGGHRAGLSGTAIIDKNEIINVADISSINFRISREVIGCSNQIFNKFGKKIGGTLIVGPPSSGKTTLLRDISRRISTTYDNGKLIKTSIIDERREIAAVYQGVPQRDIGLADVLNGFPKSDGIMRAVRTLSPKLIICDEIGNKKDAEMISQSLNCGVEIIASIHAGSEEEILRSTIIKHLINSGSIKRIILLSNNPGIIREMFEIESNL